MSKGLKIFAWIFFFPFMLAYWGYSNKNKPATIIGGVLSAFIFMGLVFSDDEPPELDEEGKNNDIVVEKSSDSDNEIEETTDKENFADITGETAKEETIDTEEVTDTEEAEESKQSEFIGYTLIEVDGGDLSGHRQAKVVVDIGFGGREYYAFTNEYGQLVRVIADQITLQEESTEPVTSQGRYYYDEAKVPGTESYTLDEGHVIADSLGGVANAYNITPQNSTLNRHGDQAYMEKVIRDALANGMIVSEFEALITYPDTTTQTPSNYKFTYKINGDLIVDDFDNINSDEANAHDNEEVSEENTEVREDTETENVVTEVFSIIIADLDKLDEYVIVSNTGTVEVNLEGWYILSVLGEQEFYFSEYILVPGQSVKVGDSGKGAVDIHWLEGRGVWNNSKSDPGELYNTNGMLIDRWDD